MSGPTLILWSYENTFCAQRKLNNLIATFQNNNNNNYSPLRELMSNLNKWRKEKVVNDLPVH